MMSPEETKLRAEAHAILDRLIDSVGGLNRLTFLHHFGSLAYAQAGVLIGTNPSYRAWCERTDPMP